MYPECISWGEEEIQPSETISRENKSMEMEEWPSVHEEWQRPSDERQDGREGDEDTFSNLVHLTPKTKIEQRNDSSREEQIFLSLFGLSEEFYDRHHFISLHFSLVDAFKADLLSAPSRLDEQIDLRL